MFLAYRLGESVSRYLHVNLEKWKSQMHMHLMNSFNDLSKIFYEKNYLIYSISIFQYCEIQMKKYS